MPAILILFASESRKKFAEKFDYSSVENYLTFGIFVFFVSVFMRSSSKHGIYFSPAEIENLFGTPLSRRQLLGYRLFVEIRTALLASLLSTCTMVIFFPNPICSLLGIWLVISLVKLLPIFLALIGETAKAHTYNWQRKVIGFLFLTALTSIILWQFGQQQFQFDWTKASFDRNLAEIANSTAGMIVLFPFRMFSRVIFASDIDGWLALYASLALLINVALVGLIMMADANYLSVVDRTSRLVAAQVKQTKMNWANESYRYSLPMLPGMFGMGPLIWRHTLTFIRSTKIFAPLAISIFIGLTWAMVSYKQAFVDNEAFPAIFLTTLGYITLLTALGFPVGFKGDIQQMENLKSLPISDWSIAVGQILSAVILASTIQLSVLLLVVVLDSARWQFWSIASVTFPIGNFLVFTVASVVLLFFPVKSDREGSTSVASLGQAMISMLSLLIGCGSIAAIVASMSLGTFYFTESVLAALLAGLAAAALAGTALTALLVYAYRRFDVSQETPV